MTNIIFSKLLIIFFIVRFKNIFLVFERTDFQKYAIGSNSLGFLPEAFHHSFFELTSNFPDKIGVTESVLLTALFGHTFSYLPIGLRSGLSDGQGKTFTLLFLKQFIVTSAVCLGSMSI